jgi:hypothetical protein
MALPHGDPVRRRSAEANCSRQMWSTGPAEGCTRGAHAPPAGRSPWFLAGMSTSVLKSGQEDQIGTLLPFTADLHLSPLMETLDEHFRSLSLEH